MKDWLPAGELLPKDTGAKNVAPGRWLPEPSLLFAVPPGTLIWSRPALWKGGFKGFGRRPSILWGNRAVASPPARGAWLPKHGEASVMYVGVRSSVPDEGGSPSSSSLAYAAAVAAA